MITKERLKEIRGQAESHTGKASGIILELLDDMEKLRALKFRAGLAPTGVNDPWPYHPHLDKTFAEVPEEDLIAWRDSRSRDVLMHDICLGIIAARDLKLYDLITQLARKPKVESIKTEPAADAAALPDTGKIQGTTVEI
jgi:hypothetical protein